MKKAYLQPEMTIVLMATDTILNVTSGVDNTAAFDDTLDDTTPTDTYLSRQSSSLFWDDDETDFE